MFGVQIYYVWRKRKQYILEFNNELILSVFSFISVVAYWIEVVGAGIII